MKSKALLAIIMLLSFLLNGQEPKNYPRLNVKFRKDFNTKLPIFIEPIVADKEFVVDHLKKGLKANGFMVVDSEVESKYVIKIVYKRRNDMGCDGGVVKDMDGRVIESSGETAINFSFGQSGFEGKCTSDLMNALAWKLKNEYKK